MVGSASFGTGTDPSGRSRPAWRPRAPAPEDPRPRCGRGERREDPVHVAHPAEVGAPLEESRRPAARSLLARHLHRRFPGGARGASRPRGSQPDARRDLAAHGRMAGGVRALAAPRSLSPPLRLRLGRRRLPPGQDGARGGVYPRHHRHHARGQEGAARLPRGDAGERPELARAAGRPQGPRPRRRTRTRRRGRRARLLEGAGRGLPGHAPPEMLGAQGRQRAQQVPAVHGADVEVRPARRLAGRKRGRLHRPPWTPSPRSMAPSTTRQSPA